MKSKGAVFLTLLYWICGSAGININVPRIQDLILMTLLHPNKQLHLLNGLAQLSLLNATEEKNVLEVTDVGFEGSVGRGKASDDGVRYF